MKAENYHIGNLNNLIRNFSWCFELTPLTENFHENFRETR